MTLSSLAVVALPAYRCDPVQNTETGILGKEWGFFSYERDTFLAQVIMLCMGVNGMPPSSTGFVNYL
jgi:hypothetical protein